MGPIADRSIILRIGANVTGLVSSLKTAEQATKDFGNKASGYITKNEQHINTLSRGVGAFGLAAVAAAGLAVKRFADFDQAMSNVAASTMESAGNMELLRAAALDAGQRTAYSATEAAAAIENLAKAGISTADVLGGGLDGALDLAAAGGIEVADAAEIAASAMTQFGLKGRDVTRIADLLAAGAGKAQGGVGDLGQALNQAGLVASQMGLSVEETVGSLTAFASAGLTGSDAGTSFRAMLLRLANPTKESADLMAELGINAYDAGGNFVGMADLAGQLQDRLGGLTQAERNQALAQIFGQDAIRTSAILYEQGAKGVREWTDAVDEQGYAAEVAAKRLDNLNGDLEQLTGALETAFINAGSAGNDMLRGMVQGATDAVNAFGSLPDPVQQTAAVLTGSAGLIALGIAGMGKLVVGINDAKQALDGLKISGKTAGLAVAGATAALAAGTIALSAWVEESARAKAMTDSLAATLDEAGNVTGTTEQAIRDMLAEGRNISMLKFDSAYTEAEKMGISFSTLTDYVLGSTDAVDKVNAAGDEFVAGSNAWENIIQSRQGAVANLTYTLDTMAASLTDAEVAELQKIEADAQAQASEEETAAAVEAATAAVEEQTDALYDLIAAQAELAGIVLGEREAQRQFEEAIDGVTDAIEQQISDLQAQYEAQGLGTEEARARAEAETEVANKLDISTEAGRRNQTALDDIAEAGWGLLESMEKNGATQDQLQATMQTTRDRFLEAAGAMGMGADEANALADEMGLIPSQVDVAITVTTDAAERRLEAFKRLLAIPDVVINTELRDAGGYYANRAAGGAIYGPGTSTSDSIPARLSNGEHVLTASDVQKLGGQAAVYGLRAAIQSGRGFASGGAVAPSRQYVGANGGASAGSAITMPPLPDIYVQNPFTGEYARAQVAQIANREALSVVRAKGN